MLVWLEAPASRSLFSTWSSLLRKYFTLSLLMSLTMVEPVEETSSLRKKRRSSMSAVASVVVSKYWL